MNPQGFLPFGFTATIFGCDYWFMFLSQDVDFPFLARSTKGFSGADLTEICQRVRGVEYLTGKLWLLY